MAKGFLCFSKLPPELRLLVWEFAVAPRTVFFHPQQRSAELYIRSSAALLLVSHEAAKVFLSLQNWILPSPIAGYTYINTVRDSLVIDERDWTTTERLHKFYLSNILQMGVLSYNSNYMTQPFIRFRTMENLDGIGFQDERLIDSNLHPTPEYESERTFHMLPSIQFLYPSYNRRIDDVIYVYVPGATKVTSTSTHMISTGRSMLSPCGTILSLLRLPVQSHWIVWKVLLYRESDNSFHPRWFCWVSNEEGLEDPNSIGRIGPPEYLRGMGLLK